MNRSAAFGVGSRLRSFRWSMLECPPKFVAWEAEQIGFNLFELEEKQNGR